MIKKIFDTGLSRFLSLAIAFAIGVIISRFFGPEGKGEITLLLLIPTLITGYFALSIEEGFLYYFGLNKISNSRFKYLLLRVFILTLPILLIIYFLSFTLFSENYEYDLLSQILLIILLFFTPIFKFSLRGLLEFKTFNLVLILEPLITLAFIILFIYFDFEIIMIIWAYIFGYLTPLIFKFSKIFVSNISKINTINLLDLYRYSFKVHFFKILNITENKFDILIIGFFLTTSDVGLYSVAVSITVIFQSLVQTSISTVLLPSLIKQKKEMRDSLTITYFKISYVLACFFVFGIFAFGNIFIVLVYGVDFELALIPMLILSIGSLFKSPTACINSFFKSNGKPEELYKTSIYSVTLNILLCLILIPKFGIIGAAIASSFSYFLYGSIMIYKFNINTKKSIFDLVLLRKSDFVMIKNLILKSNV